MIDSVSGSQSAFTGIAAKDVYAKTELEYDKANGIDTSLSEAFKAARAKDAPPPGTIPPPGSNPA